MRAISTAVMTVAVIGSLGAAPAQAVVYQTVLVGDAGNQSDWTGYGSVPYEYRIGKYEVTIGQYCEFLNAAAKNDPYGLYGPQLASNLNVAGIVQSGESGSYTYSVVGPSGSVQPGASDPGGRPVTYVSWFDAARFANWMHNGQGSGSTEVGAYSIGVGNITSAVRRNHVNVYTMSTPSELAVGDQVVIDGLSGENFNLRGLVASKPSATSFTVDVNSIYGDAEAAGTGTLTSCGPGHSDDARYWIPTENEWYKAAFFDPSAGGYWAYATRSSSPPGNAIGGAPNQINYRAYLGADTGIVSDTVFAVTQSNAWDSGQNYLTDVGAFTASASAYGTFDQNGNAAEWNEAIPQFSGWAPGSARLVRGGWWSLYHPSNYTSRVRDGFDPATKSSAFGFRLAAQAVVPEPSAAILVFGGLACLVALKVLRQQGAS